MRTFYCHEQGSYCWCSSYDTPSYACTFPTCPYKANCLYGVYSKFRIYCRTQSIGNKPCFMRNVQRECPACSTCPEPGVNVSYIVVVICVAVIIPALIHYICTCCKPRSSRTRPQAANQSVPSESQSRHRRARVNTELGPDASVPLPNYDQALEMSRPPTPDNAPTLDQSSGAAGTLDVPSAIEILTASTNCARAPSLADIVNADANIDPHSPPPNYTSIDAKVAKSVIEHEH